MYPQEIVEYLETTSTPLTDIVYLDVRTREEFANYRPKFEEGGVMMVNIPAFEYGEPVPEEQFEDKLYVASEVMFFINVAQRSDEYNRCREASLNSSSVRSYS